MVPKIWLNDYELGGIDINKLSKEQFKELEDRLEYIRIKLLVEFPFFGILLLKLPIVADYEVLIAATDFRKIFYNPKTFYEMPNTFLAWILIHETMHIALNHQKRMNERDKETWNDACDYAIHDIMYEYVEATTNSKKDYKEREALQKIIKMPEFVFYDSKFQNMPAELIYEDLMKNNKKRSEGQKLLTSHDMWGNGQPLSQLEQQQWNRFLQSTLEKVKSRYPGSFPASLDRLLKDLVKPTIDWRTVLNNFIQYDIHDYSFSPPDRRYSGNILLPAFNDVEEKVKNILIWNDTSGSISDEEEVIFYSEIVGAINSFGRLEGKLGFFESIAYEPIEFEDVNSLLQIKPKGCGGTSFYAPFEYTNEHYDLDEIVGIIIFTDGGADFPPESIANGIPVLWIITTDIVAPWGINVHFEK